MKLELSNEEAQFLYDLLDQVSIKGVQGKAAVLTIMSRIMSAAQIVEGVDEPAEEKTREDA